MAWGKLLTKAFILGIALWITLFISGFAWAILASFIPFGMLPGMLSTLAMWAFQILLMGLAAVFVLKYTPA
jgi:hypothetical protein